LPYNADVREYLLFTLPRNQRLFTDARTEKKEKIFDALEWLAAMCSHVPNKGEQMVRYYGHYSNVAHRKRKKQDQEDLIPHILEPDESSKEFRKSWARLIKKI
jgi:hypothetical protein